ncbi:MAG: HNH endonuclease [Nitrospirae bacterium]|nr:HNH endonuclease [Nitrospirota bacterium]
MCNMESVIVLNRNFEYWTEVNLRKVLKWLVQEKIEIVLVDESKEIGSIEYRIKMPLVVRLMKFVGFRPKSEKIPFSTEAVFNRDDNTCQYWHFDEKGKKFKYKCNTDDRTLDHVFPESRGGRKTFENSVCACRNCNERIKKNRTPEEAGMELIRKPVVPHRDKNSFVIMRFAFNPKKLSHKKFIEWYRGGV